VDGTKFRPSLKARIKWIEFERPADLEGFRDGSHGQCMVRRASANPVYSGLIAMNFRIATGVSRVRRIGCHPAMPLERRGCRPASSARRRGRRAMTRGPSSRGFGAGADARAGGWDWAHPTRRAKLPTGGPILVPPGGPCRAHTPYSSTTRGLTCGASLNAAG
jgi:hypothetical protein